MDENPGDRNAGCGAALKPEAYSSNKKKGFMIHYRCSKCGTHRINRFLEVDDNEADSMDALLKLSSVTENLK